MRNKFLGTGEAGYHPLRKLRTIYCGLRYAVIYDFSVAWKLIFSFLVLAVSFFLIEALLIQSQLLIYQGAFRLQFMGQAH